MNRQRIEMMKQLIIQLLEHQENVVITVVEERQKEDKTA